MQQAILVTTDLLPNDVRDDLPRTDAIDASFLKDSWHRTMKGLLEPA